MRRTFSLVVLLSAGIAIACQPPEGTQVPGPIEGTEPLPQASAEGIPFTTTEPAEAYSEMQAGILERSVFQAEGPEGVQLEIEELLVGPGQQSEESLLPGAAVFDVRSGSGTLTINGEDQPIQTGSTVIVPQDAVFSIANRVEVPLVIRAIVFVG